MPAMKTLKISIAAKISRAWPAPIGVIVLNLMAVKLQLGNADLEAPASSLAKLELRLRDYPLRRDSLKVTRNK